MEKIEMPENNFENLLTPLKIKGIELKNRIIMTPLQVNFSTDGMSNQKYKDFFGLRARSGAALIMVEPVMVNKTTDDRSLALYDDRFIPQLAELVETIHANGALTGIQLNHLGRQANLILSEDAPPAVAPSPIPWSPRAEVPKELSRDEIGELAEMFADTAKRVKEAGFDLVEVHGAHGYLVSQFLSPLSNIRTDEYGCDAKGRARFASEIIRRIREKVGEDFVISCRINGADNIAGGSVLDDTKIIAPLLVEAGLDLISISAGANRSYPTIVPGYDSPPACYVPFAEGVKRVVDVPVLGGGCINDLRMAEEVLKAGKVDLVAMTRAFIADPEIIHKTLSGKIEEIRRCVRCNTCIEKSMFGSLICLANPEAGREAEFELNTADERKTVMIIGGGLAGMETARIAALRGHNVSLYEEKSRLGGQWRLAAIPPYKQGFNSLINYLTHQIKNLGIGVKLGTTVTVAEVEAENPDVIVVATGATPLMPSIPGIDQDHVFTAQDVLQSPEITGHRVLIVGAGGIGLETAELLEDKGREVTVVEMLKKVGKDIGATIRWNLLHRLKERGIKIFTSTRVEEIGNRGVTVSNNGKQETWEMFDSVVLAVGIKSRNDLFDEVKSNVKEIYIIGDAADPRRGLDAMREGAEIGRKI